MVTPHVTEIRPTWMNARPGTDMTGATQRDLVAASLLGTAHRREVYPRRRSDGPEPPRGAR